MECIAIGLEPLRQMDENVSHGFGEPALVK